MSFELDDWVGTWELDRRENWKQYLEFCKVPAEKLDEAEKATDYHRYRFNETDFTMEHRIPTQTPPLHLLFRADIDGEWHDSPYPAPTVAHWSDKPGTSMPTWRNTWVTKPVHFKTEIPNFNGNEGKTLTIEREITSKSEIKMTVHVREAAAGGGYGTEAVVVGPCFTYMRKTSPEGPAPIAWLRSSGKPLKTAEQRHEAIEQFFKMVEENIDVISEAQAADRVVPPRFEGTAAMLKGACRMYQKLVPEWMTPEKIEDTCMEMMKAGVEADWTVVSEPKGVGIVVVPWNAPTTLACIPTLGMLASGNRVAIKAPELTPNVAAVLRRIFHKYLNGLVWVEEGGREAVERLIDESADHLVFTGGGPVAKLVAARCAMHLTPVTLELGGKSPVFFDGSLTDPMLDNGIREILELKVYKTGQFCCAHDYALVHESIYDKFCAKLKAAVEGLGEKRNVMMIARRHYNDVKGKLEEASDVESLPPMGGSFVPNDEKMTLPFTALLGPSLDKRVLSTEIFGPVLPILKIKNVQEAIDIVNSHPERKQPLISYCYSEDTTVIDAFLSETSSGNFAVNSGPMRFHMNFNVGFGGIGTSGCGASMYGKEALREFSNRRYVMRAKGGFAKSFYSGPPAAK